MIIDFNESETPLILRTKICVVGSGVMGLTIIDELKSQLKSDIILVDSGAADENKDLNALDEVINCGDVESGVDGSRARIFGGASTLWGGQALAFNKLDLDYRDWVQNSGWPITYPQLIPYYRRASRVLALDDDDFSKNIWANRWPEKGDIASHSLNLSYSKWSPSPNFAKTFGADIERAEHISALFNATVTQITLKSSLNQIEKIHIKNLAGKIGEIFADVFILCCGGIDNARILLASNKQMPQGVGNQHGNVGRYYQDHIGFYGAQLIAKDFKAFQHLFANVLVGKQKFLPKLELTESVQKSEKLVNVNGNISIQSSSDSPINLLKIAYSNLRSNGLDSDAIRAVIKAAASPVELMRILDSYYIRHRKYFPKKAKFFLIANCETEPTAESSITLSRNKDVLGVAKVKVNWQLTEISKQSMKHYYQAVKQELARLGVAQTIVKPVLFDSSDEWKSHCYSLYHHMGSTRMSKHPHTGVVDANCKVHGLANLFISGSSVFPSSSASNPTYTAMALAIRLADHLKQERLN